MGTSDVSAVNQATGAGALVGAKRSRIRQVVVYAAAAGSVVIKDGSNSGAELLNVTVPVGMHHLNIPSNGILATLGAFTTVSGAGNIATLFLS